jgi:hypothetical protein
MPYTKLGCRPNSICNIAHILAHYAAHNIIPVPRTLIRHNIIVLYAVLLPNCTFLTVA